MPDESSFLGVPSFIWWMVLFCFSVIFTTFFVRRILEWIWPILITRSFYRERFLPLFPLVLGAISALFSQHFHYPEGVGERPFTRILYGLVLGGSSGWVFKIVRSKVKSTYGVDIDLSNPPLGGVEVNVNVKIPQQDKPPVDPGAGT